MHLWEDGTVVHYYRYLKFSWPPSCAGIQRPGAVEIVFAPFISDGSTRYLCEAKDTSEAHTPKYGLLRTFSPFKSSLHLPHVVCSSGHYTHEFLACDVRSACQRRDTSGQSSNNEDTESALCRSRLFTCRNGIEHVPYSLVCDHSQDCLDSSDEDFCVHPSCYDARQFECSNKQVLKYKVYDEMSIFSLNVSTC